MTPPKLHIATTVPMSVDTLLAGQPARLAETFAVTLVAAPGPELVAAGLREGVPTRGIAMTRSITPLADLAAVWRLFRWFREERPQVVQSYTPKAGLLVMTAARLAGVPVRIHGIVGMPLMEATGLRRQVLAVAERLTYRMANQLTCNSTGLSRWVREHLRPRRELTVIGHGSINGVDVDRFRPASPVLRQQRRRELGIDQDSVVFVFVGRLVRDKGVEELLVAFEHLQRQRPEVVLLLVGEEEPERDPLSPAARQRLGSVPGVRRLGWYDDVRPAFAVADVCVLPSYREGLPTTLLEAAACGLPAVTTDINGCNEVVVDGCTGILVAAKDAVALQAGMARLLDRSERALMGAAARRRVTERFEHQAFCRALVAYYERAVGSVPEPLQGVAQTLGQRDRDQVGEERPQP
jgi:glycosyltransferase involved in cell wall biosynthesis